MKMKRKIMMTTALAATLATGALPTTSVFADVKNHPYAPHIQKLYEIGILYEKEGE